MSKADKLKKRLFGFPKDFTWEELVRVLSHYGYIELKSGGTSARKFCDERMHVINLHKPHPGNIIKSYVIKYIVEELKNKEKELEDKAKVGKPPQEKGKKN